MIVAIASLGASAEISLLSGIGLGSNSESAKFLLGAELTSFKRQGTLFTGFQESKVGLHVSDAFSLDGTGQAMTTGIEGSFRRSQGPVYFTLEGNLYFRRFGNQWVKSTAIGGSGATGRVSGSFRVDYIESARATFPWFQKDLNGIAPQNGDKPFFRAHVNVSARVIDRYNLHWSQDLGWRRAVDSDSGTLTLTTGPEFTIGSGRLAAQGGMLFGTDGIRPMGLVRYIYRPMGSKVELEVTAATDSLERLGPLVYGWLGYVGDGFDYAVALRLEESETGKLNPAVYFSIQPKF